MQLGAPRMQAPPAASSFANKKKKTQVKMIKPPNFMNDSLKLDTDAINEMWNYGGE